MSLDNSAANDRRRGATEQGHAKSEQRAAVPPASLEYSGKLFKWWHLVLAHVLILFPRTNPGIQHLSCHLPFFLQRKSKKILHMGDTSALEATIAGNVDGCALKKLNPRVYFHRVFCALPLLDQGDLRPQSHGLRQRHYTDGRYPPHCVESSELKCQW